MSNFMKIRPVEAELLNADRQTHDEAMVAFRNFAKAPTNRWQHGKCNHSPTVLGRRVDFTVEIKARYLRTGSYAIVRGGGVG